MKKIAAIFQAFCDENRIRIIKLRSGEKCACKLLEEINVTRLRFPPSPIAIDAEIVVRAQEENGHSILFQKKVEQARRMFAAVDNT